MRERRSFSRPAIIIVSVIVLVAAFAAQSSAQPGRVGGIVKDESGQPIKAATVTAENQNVGQSFTATTDDKGRFIMIGLRTGQWRFIAQAPGFAPEAGEMPVRTAGASNPALSFMLRRFGPPSNGPLGGLAAKDLQSDLQAADALFNQRKWDESIVAYRAIMAKAPSLSAINLQIAAAHRNKKDYTAAIAAYGDLLKTDPANEQATIGIATTQMEKGDLKAAEAMLAKAAEGPAPGREVLYNLGEVKFAATSIDEAMAWYEKAAAADPAWGKPLYKLGLCAMNKGDKARAAGYLNKVLAVDPVSPEAALARTAIDQLNR